LRYSDSLAVTERLAKVDLTNANWRRNLARLIQRRLTGVAQAADLA